MLVRLLSSDCAVALRHLRSLVDAEGTLGTPVERERALRPESIEAQLRHPYETYGAFVGEVLVGAASLSQMPDCPIDPDREDWYALSDVFVHPSFRGHGIGTALVKACICSAQKNGANGMLLIVNVPNPAKALYEALGFVAGEVVGAYEHARQRRDQVQMRLRLNVA